MPEQGQRTLVLPAMTVPLTYPGFPLVPPALSSLCCPEGSQCGGRGEGGGPRKGLSWSRTWNLSPRVVAGTQAEGPGRSPCPQHPRGTRPTAGQRQQRARVKPEPFNCVLEGTGGGRGQGSRAAAGLEPEEGRREKGGRRRRRAGSEHSRGEQLCCGVAPVQ